jgi:ABC-2 type transport system ATP-binding protein
LLGLARADEGTTAIGDTSIDLLTAGSVGASLEPSFHPGRTGRSHLRCLAAALGLASSRVEQMLAELDLTDVAGKRVGAYSLGQRQRLGLASALIGDPQVLVLDEPANGLDPDGVLWLRRRLRGVADSGGTVLLSSHLLSELEHVVDEVVVLQGRVLWAGTRGDVADRAGTLEALYQSLGGEAA